MRNIDLVQGSKEWLEWRRSVLTATDAAQLLGVSKYCTPYQCYQRKLGLIPEITENPAMRRGKADEPVARDRFNTDYDYNMQAVCIQSTKYPWLGASLDGLSECQKYILEVKSQRFVSEVIEMHWVQMQHQMLCTDGLVTTAYYVQIWEGETRVMKVEADLAWQKKYIDDSHKFWQKVLTNDPPPMLNKDYQDKKDNAEYCYLAQQYQQADIEGKLNDIKKEQIKKRLIEICEGQSSVGGGLRLTKKLTKGRINYKGAMEKLNISEEVLEEYRGLPSESWCVTINKEVEEDRVSEDWR